MTSDAQKQANKNQDAARKGQRFQVWLEKADNKRVERVMKREKLDSKIAAIRWLLDQDEAASTKEGAPQK